MGLEHPAAGGRSSSTSRSGPWTRAPCEGAEQGGADQCRVCPMNGGSGLV
jgi:hypothetical protein